jgi:hypothetical protein
MRSFAADSHWSAPLPVWKQAEIAIYGLVLVGAVICYFFIAHHLVLFWIANIIILGAHVSLIVKASYNSDAGALRGSLLFFALGIIYKFPISISSQ